MPGEGVSVVRSALAGLVPGEVSSGRGASPVYFVNAGPLMPAPCSGYPKNGTVCSHENPTF